MPSRHQGFIQDKNTLAETLIWTGLIVIAVPMFFVLLTLLFMWAFGCAFCD